jgi:hypothetical protein
MSGHEEILETSPDGRYRVKLVLDDCPDEPYDCSQSPLIRLDSRGYGWSAEHIQTGDRPTSLDHHAEDAAARCGTDFTLLTRYLGAWFGATKVEWWHSGSYWYITYDSAAWREWCGAPEGSADMSEYRAYCEGDVWGWVVEKNVTWSADDDRDDMSTWEHEDSCWGYYGSDGANGEYLRQSAREALEAAQGDASRTLPASPAMLAITAGPEAGDV